MSWMPLVVASAIRSSIALFVVILSRTTQTALSNQSVSGGVDVLRSGFDRDRAPTGGQPPGPRGLREPLASLTFGDRGRGCGEGFVGESADRASRWHSRE